MGASRSIPRADVRSGTPQPLRHPASGVRSLPSLSEKSSAREDARAVGVRNRYSGAPLNFSGVVGVANDRSNFSRTTAPTQSRTLAAHRGAAGPNDRSRALHSCGQRGAGGCRVRHHLFHLRVATSREAKSHSRSRGSCGDAAPISLNARALPRGWQRNDDPVAAGDP